MMEHNLLTSNNNTKNHTKAIYSCYTTENTTKFSKFEEYFTSIYSKDLYEAWFSDKQILQIKEFDDVIILKCKGDFICEYIKNHFTNILESYAKKIGTAICFIADCKITDKIIGFKTHSFQKENISCSLRLSESELAEIEYKLQAAN